MSRETALTASTDRLAQVVVRRQQPLFAADLQTHHEAVAAQVTGRKVLVVGGAGSIGSATVAQLAAFAPAQLHVADVDENGLTELVRDLRSRDAIAPDTDFRTTPVDAGSPTMLRVLRENAGYDLVLNFAAVKHVRSEKDVFGLLRMLEVNVRMPRQLLEWVAGADRYFAVSTDKAANPVNLMGATKRAMEHVIFDEPLGPQVTSARFANVAFSQGSLLEGWLARLGKGQPWAAPQHTRRYFVTPEESGQLCLLASTLGPAGRLLIPDLDPRTELRDLVEVAQDVLGELGLSPLVVHTEADARQAMRQRGPGQWPLLVTSLDTAGEKEYEEFAGDGDQVSDVGFAALRAVEAPRAAPAEIQDVLSQVRVLLQDADTPADVDAVKALVARLVPELRHRASNQGLDSRM